jgi:hypothetical protein
MIESQDAAGEPVEEMVGRRAMELLEVQGEERAQRWELLKDKVFWSAVDEGMSTADAFDMSEKVGQWTLDLIERITVTGGAGGGHA